jgi:hypothetical protein
MKAGKMEWAAGGAVLAALTGAAAAYYFKGPHLAYQRKFDSDSVEELEGTVEDIRHSGRENSEGRGVVLMLKTEKETLPVHMGPAWYIDHQKSSIRKGDHVQVVGSRIQFRQQEVIIAKTVIKGNMAIKLRNSDGHPLWDACVSL